MGQSRQIKLDFKPLKRIKVRRTNRSSSIQHIAWSRLDVWKRQKSWIRHGKRLDPKANHFRLATERVVTWSRSGSSSIYNFHFSLLVSLLQEVKASPLCNCKMVDYWSCHSDELPPGRVSTRTSCHSWRVAARTSCCSDELPLGRVSTRASCRSDELPPGRAYSKLPGTGTRTLKSQDELTSHSDQHDLSMEFLTDTTNRLGVGIRFHFIGRGWMKWRRSG